MTPTVATAHLQDDPPPLPGTIPPAVREIVTRAMAKDKADRPQGANALATLVEDLRLRGLTGAYEFSPGQGLPPTVAEKSWPLDAATPPRGSAPVRGAQHAVRRNGAAQTGRFPLPEPQPQSRRGYAQTSPMPMGGGRRPSPVKRARSRMTVPLVALLLLVLAVTAGAVWRNRAQAAEAGTPGSAGTAVVTGHALVTTGAGVASGGADVQGSGSGQVPPDEGGSTP